MTSGNYYKQVENFQDSFSLSQEWKTQQIYLKVSLWNAILDSAGLS